MDRAELGIGLQTVPSRPQGGLGPK